MAEPVRPGDIERALAPPAAATAASPKLTKGQRLYRDLFPIDPLTGRTHIILDKRLSNRVLPAPLPLPPVPFAPEIKPLGPLPPIGRDKDGRPFIIKDTSDLPARVKKVRVDVEAAKAIEIAPPTARRGSVLPPEMTPLSLQPIVEPRVKDIELPALEDWLQLVPDDLQDKEQRRQRAIRRAIAIRNTAQPPWRRVMGQIHAYVDDIEDALSTTLILARPLARRFPKLLGPLSYLAGTSELLNTVAAISAFPSTKSYRQLIIKKALGRNPFLRTTRLRRSSLLRDFPLTSAEKLRQSGLPNLARITRDHNTLGELVTVSQTMHDLFGVGLVLGPLYGTLDEIAFSLLKQERVRLRLAPQGPALSGALKGLQQAIPLLQPGVPITDKDYLLTLGSISVNTRQVLEALQGVSPATVLQNEARPRLRPPGGTSQEVLDVWEDFGEPIDESEFVWPGTFQADADPAELGEFLGEGAIEESRRRIVESDDDTFRDLATDLITDTVEDWQRVWEGPDVETANDLDTVPGAIITLSEAGLMIDPACGDAAIFRTLEKVAQVEPFMVRSALPASAIADIARREGCRLIPIAHEM